jgi:hypothetical protein
LAASSSARRLGGAARSIPPPIPCRHATSPFASYLSSCGSSLSFQRTNHESRLCRIGNTAEKIGFAAPASPVGTRRELEPPSLRATTATALSHWIWEAAGRYEQEHEVDGLAVNGGPCFGRYSWRRRHLPRLMPSPHMAASLPLACSEAAPFLSELLWAQQRVDRRGCRRSPRLPGCSRRAWDTPSQTPTDEGVRDR